MEEAQKSEWKEAATTMDHHHHHHHQQQQLTASTKQSTHAFMMTGVWLIISCRMLVPNFLLGVATVHFCDDVNM
jgi:hypothetical protein